MPDQQPAARTLAFPDARSDERIRDLARDMLAGQVLDITSVPPNLLRVVFMPLLAMPFAGWARDELERIMIFGVNTEESTASYSINGYPIFTAVHLWRLDDYATAVQLARAAKRAQEAVLGPPVVRSGEPAAEPAQPALGPSYAPPEPG